MSPSVVDIDGSFGEGGGQILRSAASMAAALGKNLRVHSIRAGRSTPGLRPQHVTAMEAVAAITGGALTGAEVGSACIELTAGKPRAGEYRFDIGTAGSAPLVLQTVLPPLLMAAGDSVVTVTGGTHNPMAPCLEYFANVLGPLLSGAGVDTLAAMARPGFYPAGAGELTLTVRGLGGPEPLIGLPLTQRGDLRYIEGLSAVSDSLPDHIGQRQSEQVIGRLRRRKMAATIEQARWHTQSPGTVVFLRAVFTRSIAGFFALGKRGRPAEAVADEAMDALEDYLDGHGALDPYAADQVLVPLALGLEPSRFTTTRITNHLLTNAEVVRRICGRDVTIEGSVGQPGSVHIGGA